MQRKAKKRKRGKIRNMITIIRNVLVISAIVLWCFIGLCYLTVFLKNKFSKGKKVNNNIHKDTFVQSGTINNSVADNEENVSDKDINNSINSNNSNKGKADNNNNEGKSNLCL